MCADSLPAIFTSEELYDQMVKLKLKVREEKKQLLDLTLLFEYCKRLMDSSIEAAFLAGADESSVHASELLNRIDRTVRDCLHSCQTRENELRAAELRHIEMVGAIQRQHSGKDEGTTPPPDKQQLASAADSLKLPQPSDRQPNEDQDVKVSSYAEDTEATEQKETFKFEDNSDGDVKISVKEKELLEEDIIISTKDDAKISDADKEMTDSKHEENLKQYKLPTF